MAIMNLRIPAEMKRKLVGLARSMDVNQTQVVREAVAEKLTVHEVAGAESAIEVPEWVPRGKYVALVRGAVAAVGDSVAEVVTVALTKFPDDAIQVSRKGKPIRPVNYAFAAHAALKCWKYVKVQKQSYPVIPTTIVGKKRLVTASSPDTGASLTLVNSRIVKEADLQPATEEVIFTASGAVKMKTFNAVVELPIGQYDAIVASTEIPKALPFQILLGRNVLDYIDMYTLGKNKVLCLKDP